MRDWSLRLAAAVFALANLAVLGAAGYDRLGPERARLSVEECRLVVRADAGGLWPMLSGAAAPVSLMSESLYLPGESQRPKAARLAEFGFSVEPQSEQPAAQAAYVAVEADGPAVDRYSAPTGAAAPPPLIVRDVAAEAETLLTRYGDRAGIAVAKGLADVTVADGTVAFTPQLRRQRLHVSRAVRRELAELSPQRGEDCRSRFMAEIVYGAAFAPRLARLRPLERIENDPQN